MTSKTPGERLTVETAAIWVGGAVFTLPRPNRHHNIMWWLSFLGIRSGQMHRQGFVLSDGTFADRDAAACIALSAGQVDKLTAPPNLYSEDLWDGGADMPTPADLERMTRPTAPASGLGEEEIEAMCKAHHEASCPAHETPAGGLTRWATWAEVVELPGERERRITIMRAALAALSPPPRDGGSIIPPGTQATT